MQSPIISAEAKDAIYSGERAKNHGARPLAPKGGNDRIYTPPELAKKIVAHFHPSGRMLEPCRGKGAFFTAMRELSMTNTVESCELDEGTDFLKWHRKCDWIVTNPPYSKFRDFLNHSMKVADNVVFLCLTNAWYMKARQRDIEGVGFGLVEILHLDTPPNPWPQAGFQLGAGWLRRGWKGSTYIHKL